MDNMLQRPILASKLCEILYEYRAGCSSFRVCDRFGVSITAGPAGREEKNKKTETKLFAGIFTVRFRFITILFCRSRARFNNNSSSDSIIFLLFRFTPILIKFPVIMIRDRNYYRRVCVYCTCRTVFFFFPISRPSYSVLARRPGKNNARYFRSSPFVLYGNKGNRTTTMLTAVNRNARGRKTNKPRKPNR